jgi:hypothetical protein
MTVTIRDNFLPHEEFTTLVNAITQPTFPWFKRYAAVDPTNHEVLCLPQYNNLLGHTFYESSQPFAFSSLTPILNGLLSRLDIEILLRVVANYNPRTETHIVHGYHSDIEHFHKELEDQVTTSILYLNTNDGYTYFEDGQKVKSVANRLVTFPVATRHSSSTCTDADERILINLCYIKVRK